MADAVKQRLGADAGLAEATVAPRHVLHADGKACGVETSSLCDIIAHPDTTVEDIEDRVFGHAQFECAYALLQTQQFEKLRAYSWCLVPHCPSSASCVSLAA